MQPILLAELKELEQHQIVEDIVECRQEEIGWRLRTSFESVLVTELS